MRHDNLIYAQVGAEAAPPYSTFTVLLLLSGKLVGAAESALPLRAAAAAGMIRARPHRAAKSMAPSAWRIDRFAVRYSRGCKAHCGNERTAPRRRARSGERSYSSHGAPKVGRRNNNLAS